MAIVELSTRSQMRGRGTGAGHGWGEPWRAFYSREGHDGFCSVQLSISPKFSGVSLSHPHTHCPRWIVVVWTRRAPSRLPAGGLPPFGRSETRRDWTGQVNRGRRQDGRVRASRRVCPSAAAALRGPRLRSVRHWNSKTHRCVIVEDVVKTDFDLDTAGDFVNLILGLA